MEILRQMRFQRACVELSRNLDLVINHFDVDSETPLVLYGTVPDDPAYDKVIYLYRRAQRFNYRIEYVALGNESDDRLRGADILRLEKQEPSGNWELRSSRRYYIRGMMGPGIPSRESFKKIHKDPNYAQEWSKLIPTWERWK